MIITKIEKFKYSYKIYVDDEYVGIVTKKTIRDENICEKKDINSIESFKKIILENEYESAKNKVLRQLGFSGKTEKEVFIFLKKNNFQLVTIERVIEFLKGYKLINDKDYIETYTESIKNCGKSKNFIKDNLYKKGFDKELVCTALESISEEDEFKSAMSIAKKKLKQIKSEDNYERAKKLKQYLTYKGFNYNIADKVVKFIISID
ncbi:MAG: regulatory protein RecX [Filifactoraceae bacterium]